MTVSVLLEGTLKEGERDGFTEMLKEKFKVTDCTPLPGYSPVSGLGLLAYLGTANLAERGAWFLIPTPTLSSSVKVSRQFSVN